MSDEGAWEITVLHPMKKLRFGKLEKDEDRGVLRITDQNSVDEIPLSEVVGVEDLNARWEQEDAEPISLSELFDGERVMQMLQERDEQGDPKWMVPVIFDAPDVETAFWIKDTIDMLVKQGALRYADMYERNIHVFCLNRFDMWNPSVNETVERPKR